jgi:arsenical pump membrane protein
LICAFVANAASFVLPISNPANLVIFAGHMPTLTDWIGRFGAPAMLSIAATFLVLRWNQRGALNQVLESKVTVPTLSSAGKLAAGGIGVTAIALMMASAFGLPLGWPTCAAAFVALSLVTAMTRGSPWRYLREVSWGVIPLVAGLFIFVEALHYTGVIQALSEQLGKQIQHSTGWAAVAAGLLVAFGSNLINNLPAGLIAGTVLQSANAASVVSSAALIGVDVGPNLSVTGSLATILWLTALRRDGVQIRSWDFLRVGLWVMPAALILPLAALVTMA